MSFGFTPVTFSILGSYKISDPPKSKSPSFKHALLQEPGFWTGVKFQLSQYIIGIGGKVDHLARSSWKTVEDFSPGNPLNVPMTLLFFSSRLAVDLAKGVFCFPFQVPFRIFEIGKLLFTGNSEKIGEAVALTGILGLEILCLRGVWQAGKNFLTAAESPSSFTPGGGHPGAILGWPTPALAGKISRFKSLGPGIQFFDNPLPRPPTDIMPPKIPHELFPAHKPQAPVQPELTPQKLPPTQTPSGFEKFPIPPFLHKKISTAPTVEEILKKHPQLRKLIEDGKWEEVKEYLDTHGLTWWDLKMNYKDLKQLEERHGINLDSDLLTPLPNEEEKWVPRTFYDLFRDDAYPTEGGESGPSLNNSPWNIPEETSPQDHIQRGED